MSRGGGGASENAMNHPPGAPPCPARTCRRSCDRWVLSACRHRHARHAAGQPVAETEAK